MNRKSLVKIVALILAMVLCLTACGGGDTHTDPCESGHTYDNACDTSCNACGASREVDGHIYDDACDERCNNCNVVREVDDHVFDNACDTDCNVCGNTRKVGDHVDANTDYLCDECGVKVGEPPCPHSYDNDCDTECNECGATRSVNNHAYDNACDVDCNVCGTTRKITHAYENDCDVDCDVCGATRAVGDHVDEGGDNKCDNCGVTVDDGDFNLPEIPTTGVPAIDLSAIPKFDNSKEYVTLGGNVPFFTYNQLVTEAYAYYSPLDKLGRAGFAVACLGTELFPTADRGSLPNPTGWHSGSVYERSHLVAHSLAGFDGATNLITGTYDLNGVMQEFEEMVKDYIVETGNHVMYRVTPVFEGENLVCSGVVMEGWSVEDDGEGICFCIYIYNAQDDEIIDYASGDVTLPARNYTFVVNRNNWKIHTAACSNVAGMNDENKYYWEGSYAELVAHLNAEGKSWTNGGCCKPQNSAAGQVLFTLPSKEYLWA